MSRDFTQREGHPCFKADGGVQDAGPAFFPASAVVDLQQQVLDLEERLKNKEHDRAETVSLIAETLTRTHVAPTDEALHIAEDIVTALENAP